MVRFFNTVLTLLSVAAVALGTADIIQKDIASLSTSVTTLDNEIKAFPTSGGSLSAAFEIHATAVAVSDGLATTASDIAATASLTLAEATAILSAIIAVKPIIIEALNELIVKEAAFASLALGVIVVIRADLNSLSGNVNTFGSNFLNICPSSLVPLATSTESEINVALQAAISAYAS